MNPPSTVATVRCPGYGECRESIARTLELSGLDKSLKGRRVLLKPNMMKGTPPGTPEATHPEFTGVLTGLLKDLGCTVRVGDSTGIIGFTKEVFSASGTTDAVERNGGTVVNFDAGPFVMIDLGGQFAGTKAPVSREFLEAEAVLDVPKIKTHTFLGLTLSVKNFMGAFPGAVKPWLHTLAPGRDDFAGLVAGIPAALEAAGVNLAGSVVDGVLVLGGRGGSVPAAPAWMNCVVAGKNLFDVDMVCAGLAGFDFNEVPLCRIGASRGLGASSPADIAVTGDKIVPVVLVRPGTDLTEAAPPLTLAYYTIRRDLVKPEHDPAACEGCNKCVDVCPVGCILVRGAKDRAIGDDCVKCLACREVCPTGAMGLRANRCLTPFLKKRAKGLDMGRLRRN